jgi:hypothetical protein
VTGFTADAESQIAPVELTPTATEPVTGHSGPITVHIEESTEPEDVNDNAGAGLPPVTADDLAAARQLLTK